MEWKRAAACRTSFRSGDRFKRRPTCSRTTVLSPPPSPAPANSKEEHNTANYKTRFMKHNKKPVGHELRKQNNNSPETAQVQPSRYGANCTNEHQRLPLPPPSASFCRSFRLYGIKKKRILQAPVFRLPVKTAELTLQNCNWREEEDGGNIPHTEISTHTIPFILLQATQQRPWLELSKSFPSSKKKTLGVPHGSILCSATCTRRGRGFIIVYTLVTVLEDLKLDN